MKNMKIQVAAIALFSALAATAETPRPNILFIIADDVSHDSLGSYGCTYIEMPNLDRLAEEGARFENAFCCNPSVRRCVRTSWPAATAGSWRRPPT
jgi:N-sulfoglucosamine sulfohydrolase